jgi:hypothetical protein
MFCCIHDPTLASLLAGQEKAMPDARESLLVAGCRTARLSETPSIISDEERKGGFDDQRSAGDPPQVADPGACVAQRGR